MKHYIIAAGGTGAMCVRSLIYLAAAGCLPESTYYILLVDMDRESDATNKCKKLMEGYNNFYELMNNVSNEDKKHLRLPELVLVEWNFADAVLCKYASINGVDVSKIPQLSSLTLKHLYNSHGDAGLQRVLDTLYTPAEQNMKLDEGFRGHPNVGCAVFNYVADEFVADRFHTRTGGICDNRFMQKLKEQLFDNLSDARVYVFGSVFGGTGASIFPNVINRLHSWYDELHPNPKEPAGKLQIGGSLLLPYFSLPTYCGDGIDKDAADIVPNDLKFENQTRMALEFYGSGYYNIDTKMKNLFVVGLNDLNPTSEIWASGGDQTQHFHFVLVLAVLAACNFFRRKTIPENFELSGWAFSISGAEDLPTVLARSEMNLRDLEENVDYDFKMAAFLRFCFINCIRTRGIFNADLKDLKGTAEILCTCKHRMKVWEKNKYVYRPIDPDTEDDKLNQHYVYPIIGQNEGKGSEPESGLIPFCRSYMEFYRDFALSGFSWENFHNWQREGRGSIKLRSGGENAKRKNAAQQGEGRIIDAIDLNQLMEASKEDASEETLVGLNVSLSSIMKFMPKGREKEQGSGDGFMEQTVEKICSKARDNCNINLNIWKQPKTKDAYLGELFHEIYAVGAEPSVESSKK